MSEPVLRPATHADVEARFAALGATPDDAMVLEGDDPGQAFWGRRLRTQDDWRRRVKPLG